MVERVVMVQHLFAAGLNSATINEVLPCLQALRAETARPGGNAPKGPERSTSSSQRLRQHAALARGPRSWSSRPGEQSGCAGPHHGP